MNRHRDGVNFHEKLRLRINMTLANLIFLVSFILHHGSKCSFIIINFQKNDFKTGVLNITGLH